MKKRKCLFKTRLQFVLLAILLGTGATAQSVKDSRFREAYFAVSPGTTLEVENKYGTILIVPWQKDSAKISVEMYMEAKNTSKLRKLKNDLSIDFSGSSSYIIARTRIGEGGSRIASEIRTLSNTLSSNNALEVNYTIFIPEYLDLVLINKFGDIYIDDLYGTVDIELSNGSLKANSISGNSSINLAFAKGNIRELGTSTLRMSYAELGIEKVQQLDLISKSSELEIDTIGVMKTDSRRDKIILGEVEYLYGEASFTEIKITEFVRELDASMKYGNLKIDKVLPEFSRIELNSDYTDIDLYFTPECSYAVDMLHHEKAVVQLPAANSTIETKRAGEEMNASVGYVGAEDSDRKVNIRATHKCFIKLSSR